MSHSDQTLADALRGNFVVVDLGAGGDTDSKLPAALKKATTLITVDAGDSAHYGDEYCAMHTIRSAVADAPGRRTFRRNKYVGCSSLLPPKEDIIRMYGVESLFAVDQTMELECKTLLQIISELKLDHVDLLKTDLEGLDFGVIQSFAPKLDRVLAVLCELRFQPAYDGEPYCHEVIAWLQARGFELVSLAPAYWKYKTQHRSKHRDGRITFADCLFLKKSSGLDATFPAHERALARAKQIVIAAMMGKTGLAEYLLESSAASLPAAWQTELQKLALTRRFDLRQTKLWMFLWWIKRSFSKFDYGFITDRS